MGGNMPDAGILATILLIVGLVLLALELMIPSFGMIGLLSALALLISAWCAWQAWWEDSPGFFWTYFAFWLIGIPAVLGGMLFVLQNTSFGDRIVLRGPQAKASPETEPDPEGLHHLIGKIGQAASLLTPGGMVTIDNKRFHAESPGMVIENGAAVEVVDVKGPRLVVRNYTENPDAVAGEAADNTLDETQIAAANDSREESDVLDFELREG